MKGYALSVIMVMVISFIAMGCSDDSSNESPNAVLVLEPDEAWIFDNATSTTNPDITFNATASEDPDGDIRNYRYDFGDGTFIDSQNPTLEQTYTIAGFFTTGLTVQDDEGDEESTQQSLTINYQYLRTDEVLETTSGGTDSADHPFPVSSYNPDEGEITVEVNAPDIGNPPSVNVIVFNADDQEVAREREENIQGNVTITIDIDEQDFDDFGYDEWHVTVECEDGNIQYDITVRVLYSR